MNPAIKAQTLDEVAQDVRYAAEMLAWKLNGTELDQEASNLAHDLRAFLSRVQQKAEETANDVK